MARVPHGSRDGLDTEGQAIYDRIRLDRNAPEVGFVCLAQIALQPDMEPGRVSTL